MPNPLHSAAGWLQLGLPGLRLPRTLEGAAQNPKYTLLDSFCLFPVCKPAQDEAAIAATAASAQCTPTGCKSFYQKTPSGLVFGCTMGGREKPAGVLCIDTLHPDLYLYLRQPTNLNLQLHIYAHQHWQKLRQWSHSLEVLGVLKHRIAQADGGTPWCQGARDLKATCTTTTVLKDQTFQPFVRRKYHVIKRHKL